MNALRFRPISPSQPVEREVPAQSNGPANLPASAESMLDRMERSFNAGEFEDSFGPDDDGAEDAVPSRDVADPSEVRIDDSDDCHGQMIGQQPRGMPAPVQPSPEEIALHWLTHIPYRSWCKWCVAAKRANSPHCAMPASSRDVPLFVVDYCYLRDGRDEDLLTCLVGRLYPSRALISVPCDVKGIDDYAIDRLA